MAKLTYQQTGDNYDTKDPIKILAQSAAKATAINLTQANCKEVSETRGESAFVWDQGDCYMASVIEGLGTKNLVADRLRSATSKTYYDVIGHDTVATIINDLISVGAKPLVMHAYWAIESNEWLADEARMRDLITGWKDACDIAGCTWGGGETPTLKQILIPRTAEFGGSAVGIIKNKEHLITDEKMQDGDKILLLKSTGINANGLSLARAVAEKLPQGYATKMKNGQMYGEGLLAKSNIYAKLIQDLLQEGIAIHYVSNITGHGLRKIMRARREFTYTIENIFDPQEVFTFIQEHAELSDGEMYETYNMGMDYAMFMPKDYIARAQEIVTNNGFESIDAGYITLGERKVIIEPKNITFGGESLRVR
jgi:phosphoribosylformylglycinamidine cyclo-ligase